MKWMSIFISATLLACEGGATSSALRPTVTDSAGVRIVQYEPLPTWNAEISLTEILRIGAAEGSPEVLFSRIAGGRILQDGSIVLADRGSSEIRQFARDGTFLRLHGREGEGPGEYQYIRGMGNCSSSGFTVFDIDWTMSSYDDAGDFVDESVSRLEGASSPYHMACDPEGRLAAINWDLSSGPQLGFYVSMARLRILSPDGTELADLGERIGSERFGRPTGSSPHPAGKSTLFGFQSGDLVVSDGSFLGFERWDRTGKLLEIVRIDVPPPNLDSLMVEYEAWSLSRARDDETRRRYRKQIAEIQGPSQASFSSDLFVSEARILLREPTIGESGRWFEFKPDGTPVGFLPLPPGAALLDAKGDLILVAVAGEFDVPVAILYSVTEAGGTRSQL